MKKVMRIGKLLVYPRGSDIYVKAELENGRLSLSGVIGPTSGGDARGGAGQINMEFKHRDPSHDDRRTDNPYRPDQIDFAPGWSPGKWYDLLEIWHDWHLNDMRAGCEHQRAMGWTYEEHHDPKTFKGEPCPVCGYEIGSAWLREELPQSVIDTLDGFPNTDQAPAWI